jgi:hypothetical protein
MDFQAGLELADRIIMACSCGVPMFSYGPLCPLEAVMSHFPVTTITAST